MVVNLNCGVCGKIFSSKYPWTKNCSDDCRRKNSRISSGREAIRNKKIATGTVGAISELVVSADLMHKGYSVFRALSPANFADLFATKDGKNFFIEVRTGYQYISTGNLMFPRKTHGPITHFGIYERNTGEIFYFEADGKTPCSL